MDPDPITLQLPDSANLVYNSLYPSLEPRFLDQDVLLIQFPDGASLDVGWYPSHDPTGNFVIEFYPLQSETAADGRQVWPEVRDPYAVVEAVQCLAAQYVRGEVLPAVVEGV